MMKLKEMKMALVNAANELLDNEEFVNAACGTIGTVGILFQIKMACKFYKAMIPTIKADENKGLKLVHILLCLYMTYVYTYNISYTIECCKPSKKLEDLKETSEGFDDDLID